MDIFNDPSTSFFGLNSFEPLSRMLGPDPPQNRVIPPQQETELKKESVSSETDQHKSKVDTSIEERRRRGKIRSKRSRDKKKLYLQGLEEKIKELQKENFRLQNLVANYRSEKLEYYGEEIKTFEKDSRKQKLETFKNFIDPETLEFKKITKETLGDIFAKNCKFQMDRHKNFMDGIFKILVNHICPFDKFFKKCPSKEYTTDFETIKELSKLEDKECDDFAKQNNIDPLDVIISRLKPSRRQFLCMKNVFFKKKLQIAEKYREGINLLFQAKDIFQEASVEVCVTTHFMFNSKVFSDEEFLKKRSLRDLFSAPNSFEDFWKVQTQPVEYANHVFTDPILGKRARKVLPEDKKIDGFCYNQFKLPE
ncbi:unnamed protein product [Moneuplotes crassus]|uniref:BZIP domain-containing protein n=1 Tax=Euplotes crassus TaxID=5936 RepID=A0AAD1XJP7_EUPCR|nr:unnamed protein product [Moneuplotes crassus]